jgi:formyltetrahydrofolate deformylase
MRSTAVLLIHCPDRKGLVAAVASILYRHGANITHADQHQDHGAGIPGMRPEAMPAAIAIKAEKAST